MTENMKTFLDAIQNDEELKKKFDEITGKEQAEQKDYSDEYIALAKECGIDMTEDDFEFDEEELSDEDLEKVSGGGTKVRSIHRTFITHSTPHRKSTSQPTSGGDSGTGEETESE